LVWERQGRITLLKKKKISRYSISVKEAIRLTEPFLWLARQFSGDAELSFVQREE
jgi:hypothetical protein